MPDRAAIVTGASGGIGLAVARALGEEGLGLTIAGRRPERVASAAGELRAAGYDVEEVEADLGDEDGVRAVVERHRERYGRLDVLVNNAGVGLGAPVGETRTKRLDLQLDVNLRATILFYRECADLLREAAAERGTAQVINMASVAGKSGQPWLSVYSATKAGVVAFTQAMNRELGSQGVKSVALCPGYVNTEMTDFIKEEVAPQDMIQPSDIAEAVRFLLHISPKCVVPEIVFQRPEAEL
jgi:NAD(P)-dependent dehydrogenase (short-subunit alcohol dehydrogenase family)